MIDISFKRKSIFGDGIFFLVCVCSVIWIRDVVGFVNDWNHQFTWFNTWYGIYGTYWTEIFMLKVLWDLFLYRINENIFDVYYELTQRFATNKFVLVKLIRLKYELEKLYYYLRFGILKFSYSKRSELIDYLVAPSLLDVAKGIFLSFFKLGSFIAVILTVLTYENFTVQDLLVRASSVWKIEEVILWDNFTKLSALVILVLALFLGYFVSRKGIIRRSIAQANRKKLEDVIQLHRKLANPIIKVVEHGVENISYAINCHNLLLKYYKYKTMPSLVKKRDYLWLRDNEFRFKDISEIGVLISVFGELLSSENKAITMWFARHHYELINTTIKFRLRKRIADDLDKYLFTPSGFKEMFDRKSLDGDFLTEEEFERKLQNDIEFFTEYTLNRNIINGVEFAYALYRYLVVLDRLLHIDSDKVGRILRTFTGKE